MIHNSIYTHGIVREVLWWIMIQSPTLSISQIVDLRAKPRGRLTDCGMADTAPGFAARMARLASCPLSIDRMIRMIEKW